MKPGIIKILFGVLLSLAGPAVTVFVFILPMVNNHSGAVVFKVPGVKQVEVDEPGKYYLWNNYQTVFESKSYSKSENIPDGTTIKITDLRSGETYDFQSSGSMSSQSGSDFKNSIGYVQISDPGIIKIEVSGIEERVFSFSKFDFKLFVSKILKIIAINVFLGLSGVGLIIWGIVNLATGKKKEAVI